MQVDALQCRCATQLMRNLTVDSFAETAVLADRVKHQGLLDACLDFAMHDKNRWAFFACHTSSRKLQSDVGIAALARCGQHLAKALCEHGCSQHSTAYMWSALSDFICMARQCDVLLDWRGVLLTEGVYVGRCAQSMRQVQACSSWGVGACKQCN